MDYPTIFNQIALISLFVLGFRTITNKGAIGYFLKEPFDYYKDSTSWVKWIGKPLITCVKCMPSFWGTAIFFACNYIDPMPLYYWPLAVIPSCFISAIMWEVITYFNVTDYS